MNRMVAALLLVALAGRAGAHDGFDQAWQRVDNHVGRLLSEQGVVGGALWFVQGTEPLGTKLYGTADLERQRPVDADTVFHWASITKTLTGIAIMQLRDRGLLSLDDPVVDYLPEIRAIHDPFGPIDELTIRHVLTHATGMRASTWPWGGDEPWHPFEPTRWEQLVAMFPYTSLEFRPGSRFRYSNPAIILLGRIIEVLSGDPYQAYMHKNLLMPLGMHRSYFDTTPPHLVEHRANSYVVIEGTPQAYGPDFDTGITVSNSGLNAPIPDMVRYAAFLAGDQQQHAVHERVLRRSSLEEMFEPRLAMTDPVAEHGPAVQQRIGLGFFVVEAGGGRLIGHTGSQRGFRAFLYVDPATDTAAIAAFNTVSAPGARAAKPDAERVLAEVRDQVMSHLFPRFR